MGMGMAEGEWAAKRGLPALSQPGSLGGRTLAASEVGQGKVEPQKSAAVGLYPFFLFSVPSEFSSLLPAAWMFSNTWFFSFPHLGFSGGGGSCS